MTGEPNDAEEAGRSTDASDTHDADDSEDAADDPVVAVRDASERLAAGGGRDRSDGMYGQGQGAPAGASRQRLRLRAPTLHRVDRPTSQTPASAPAAHEPPPLRRPRVSQGVPTARARSASVLDASKMERLDAIVARLYRLQQRQQQQQ